MAISSNRVPQPAQHAPSSSFSTCRQVLAWIASGAALGEEATRRRRAVKQLLHAQGGQHANRLADHRPALHRRSRGFCPPCAAVLAQRADGWHRLPGPPVPLVWRGQCGGDEAGAAQLDLPRVDGPDVLGLQLRDVVIPARCKDSRGQGVSGAAGTYVCVQSRFARPACQVRSIAATPRSLHKQSLTGAACLRGAACLPHPTVSPPLPQALPEGPRPGVECQHGIQVAAPRPEAALVLQPQANTHAGGSEQPWVERKCAKAWPQCGRPQPQVTACAARTSAVPTA